MTNGPFYGKYRGVVIDNRDPLLIGRIRATVPDVLGDRESEWAMPCAPFGGPGMGFFALPAPGAGVWVEFEQGDLHRPIWSGVWWASAAEVPPVVVTPPYGKVVVRSEGGHTITLDDTAGGGGITLETASGQRLVLSASGVELTNGTGATITLCGPDISLNDGALDVT